MSEIHKALEITNQSIRQEGLGETMQSSKVTTELEAISSEGAPEIVYTASVTLFGGRIVKSAARDNATLTTE